MQNISTVCLEGTPRERGRMHGEALRPLIAQGMERWKATIGAATGLRADDYIERFVQATDYLPAIERWTPSLLDEVRGLGDGAGVPFRDIYAYQLMDEEWLFRTDLRRGTAQAPLEHCSVIGVLDANTAPLLAQNMDLPKYYDGTQTLLRVKHWDSAVEALVFTAAGLIGTNGLNNHGVGLCCNTLTQLAHAYHGLPVAFVTRRVLASQSQEEAIGFVREISHASGQNYAIGGPREIVDLECSAGKVAQFAPGARRFCHTNHPLVNDDQPARRAPLAAGGHGGSGAPAPAGATTALSNSEQRYAFLDRAMDAPHADLGVERVKALLSTREVPISVARDSDGDGMTLGSLVMELAESPVLFLAPGPPAQTEYARWTF